MRLLYLVSVHEVLTSVPIRNESGGLIAFTARQPDGTFAAVLTRAQWDEFRRTKWVNPTLDVGFLVPDVKVQATDGRIFTTLEECQAYEELLFLNEEIPEEPGLREAHHIPESNHSADPAALDTALEAAIVKAVSSKSLLVADLDHLGASKDEIKAVMKQTKLLRWAGPRICLAKTSDAS